MTIGTKIKGLRSLCGFTQEELANRCDLTKGYISQLENDLTSPSISTLTDILSALGTNLKTFFSDEDEDDIVFTEEDYFVKEEDHYKITWLVPNSQKNEMEPILFELAPHALSDKDMPHEGEEFGYVLEGKVTVVYGNKTVVCQKGESFYFATSKDHYLKNNTNKPVKLIWVSSPPNF
ncbi:MAG: cupin domain-containing protein [Bacilli bacterium]|nr:cupin domain-containing protein [Bacilli bacterium]